MHNQGKWSSVIWKWWNYTTQVPCWLKLSSEEKIQLDVFFLIAFMAKLSNLFIVIIPTKLISYWSINENCKQYIQNCTQLDEFPLWIWKEVEPAIAVVLDLSFTTCWVNNGLYLHACCHLNNGPKHDGQIFNCDQMIHPPSYRARSTTLEYALAFSSSCHSQRHMVHGEFSDTYIPALMYKATYRDYSLCPYKIKWQFGGK